MNHLQKKFSIYGLCSAGLGAALMSLCAWISIPTAVPFTLQTFGVFLVVGLLGGRYGALSVAVYLLLGAVGQPVFSGFRGGMGMLFGVTGGYLLGFFFAAVTTGWLLRGGTPGRIRLFLSMWAGLLVCYAFGSAWFLLTYAAPAGTGGLGAVLSACVLPFLLPDAIKLALAAELVLRLRRHLRRPSSL